MPILLCIGPNRCDDVIRRGSLKGLIWPPSQEGAGQKGALRRGRLICLRITFLAEICVYTVIRHMGYTFQTEQWLPYPVEDVFALFADPRNLPLF